MSRKGCWETKITLSEIPSSVPPFPGNFIHGTHGAHGFSLKIILKIFVKISSISDAIQNKTLPRSEVFERIFLSRIMIKDFICCLPELQIISGHRPYFIKDFPQRFLAKQPPKNPRNTWRTRILVKDYSKDFVLCCLSARCFGVAITE